MAIPFFLVGQVLVSATTGWCIGTAVGHTVNGISNLTAAQSIGNSAENLYYNACNQLKSDVDQINLIVEKYVETQLEALCTIYSVYNLVDSKPRILERFNILFKPFDVYQMSSVDSGQIVCAGAGAVTEALTRLAASTLIKGIQAIGIRDTINYLGLYGVKATTTKVLAASASSIALGSVFSFVLPPTFAAMSGKFSAETQQVLTNALEYSANVETIVMHMERFRNKIRFVEARLLELHHGIHSMTELVKQGLYKFNALSNDRKNKAIYALNSGIRTGHNSKNDLNDDIEMLQLLLYSASCLALLLSKARVLDENGQLCSDSVTLFEQYKP